MLLDEYTRTEPIMIMFIVSINENIYDQHLCRHFIKVDNITVVNIFLKLVLNCCALGPKLLRASVN